MASKVHNPKFSHSVIQDNRKDGYWVETFKFHEDDRAPGIIASGLVSGVVEYLENPIADPSGSSTNNKAKVAGEWKRYEIGKFDSPVAVCAADITQNGLMDLVICHDYGPFMLECDPKGGHVTWLENPGRESLDEGHWKEHFIGRWPAMHRVKAGHFTQKSFLEVVAASVVYGPHDKTTPIPIIRFQAPDTSKIKEAAEWYREVIDDQNFTVIHEICPKKFNGANGLDSLLVASREGTTHLYFSPAEHIWKRDLITIGEPRRPGQSSTSESPGSGDHWGSGCVDAGRIGDDPFAYIATLDPFHGTTACVYTKIDTGLDGTPTGGWKRHVLDVYGTPNQLKHTGDGPGHYIVCADFDGDGDDEFLLALFGSLNRDETGEAIPPQAGPDVNKGVMYYKALDLEKGIWAKYKIAEESSARIALGNFAGRGRIDFVSMSYNVDRYYTEPQPKVTIHLNEFAPRAPEKVSTLIAGTVWNNEGLIYLPDPIDADAYAAVKLIEVAGYSISVDVLKPGDKLKVDPGTGVKVIYGAIKDGDEWRKPLGVPRFTKSDTTIRSGQVVAHNVTGALLLRLKPITSVADTIYPTTTEVPVKTMLDVSKYHVHLDDLRFIKVQDLSWGHAFQGLEFYNLSGFSFRFARTQAPIAHIQFWTAGKGVNCGVHNHKDAIFEEIHICLSPGTGDGGMALLKDEYINTPSDQMNALGAEAFDQLALPRLYEHGGMWYRDSYGNAIRDPASKLVEYPWHKWQAGGSNGTDVWMAVEFSPDLNFNVGEEKKSSK